jgi:KDO2-lipid IV(A) lauroyltransferase
MAAQGFRLAVRKAWRKIYRPILRPFITVLDYMLALVVRVAVRAMKKLDADASSDFMGRMARAFGPFVPANRTGLDNLHAAYPEKSEAEIGEILGGVWENLGRVAGEFVYLEKLWELRLFAPDRRPYRDKRRPQVRRDAR